MLLTERAEEGMQLLVMASRHDAVRGRGRQAGSPGGTKALCVPVAGPSKVREQGQRAGQCCSPCVAGSVFAERVMEPRGGRVGVQVDVACVCSLLADAVWAAAVEMWRALF